MRYFYEKLRPELRMPMEQIHFWTKENADSYSDLIDAEGGADVCYTALSWSGGIGAIDAETFKADSMEELLSMGSRIVTPMVEFIAHESLRGMFGCSGDIGNVPQYPPRSIGVYQQKRLHRKSRSPSLLCLRH